MTIPWFYSLPRSWRLRRALKGWHYIRSYNGSRRRAAEAFLHITIWGKFTSPKSIIRSNVKLDKTREEKTCQD